MTGPEDLPARIRAARTALKMTQAELAEKVGVNRNAISDWEAGRHHPRTSLPALEVALGADFSSRPERTTSPRLDEASDAQFVAEAARRLAVLHQQVRDLKRRLGESDDASDGPEGSGSADATVVRPERWAARKRRKNTDD